MNKNIMLKIIAGICVVAGILTYAFLSGGDSYEYHNWSANNISSDSPANSNGTNVASINQDASDDNTEHITESGTDTDTVNNQNAASEESGDTSSDNQVSNEDISGFSNTASDNAAADSKSQSNKDDNKNSSSKEDSDDGSSSNTELSGGAQSGKDLSESADNRVDNPLNTEAKVPETASPSNKVDSNTQTEYPNPTDIPVKPDPTGKSCTISISCIDVLDNIDKLDSSKRQLIPSNGMILEDVTVPIEGDMTAFDVLKTVTTKNKIHLECSYTALYNSSYIEGIANIYEFDCGPLSGWKYYINGECPSYGCSQYKLKDGDVLEFEFMCNAAGAEK